MIEHPRISGNTVVNHLSRSKIGKDIPKNDIENASNSWRPCPLQGHISDIIFFLMHFSILLAFRKYIILLYLDLFYPPTILINFTFFENIQKFAVKFSLPEKKYNAILIIIKLYIIRKPFLCSKWINFFEVKIAISLIIEQLEIDQFFDNFLDFSVIFGHFWVKFEPQQCFS